MNDQDLSRHLRVWSMDVEERYVATSEAPPAVREGPDEVDPLTDYVPDVGTERRDRWLVRAAVLVSAMLLAGVGTAYLSGRGGQAQVAAPSAAAADFTSGPCETPGPRATGLSEDELRQESERALADAQATIEEGERTGFEKFSAPSQDGTEMCGWIRVASAQPGFPKSPVFSDEHGGQDVYDAIDGAVMGTAYPYLGFFTIEETQRPGFDPVALRIERFGCDPLSDSTCRPPTQP